MWRWAKDHLGTKETSIFKHGVLSYDKIQHLFFSFIFSIILYYSGVLFFGLSFSSLCACLIIFGLGILWEVKDALVPWEEHGFWGGDGFSFLDLLADAVGCSLAFFLIEII